MSAIDIAIEDYCKDIKDPKILEMVIIILRIGYKCGRMDQKSGEINWDFINKKYPIFDTELK